MKLLFFTEARLFQTNDGKFCCENQSFSYQMFKRYLDVFDHLFVVARTAPLTPGHINDGNRVDHEGVEVLPLPFYIGPFQYLKNRNKLLMAMRRYIDLHPNAAAICRVPGIIGTAAARYMTRKNRPYGVEVVGDPHDVFARGSFDHPLRAVFRYVGVKNLKTVINTSSASLYVTKESLQARYSPGINKFTINASNIELKPNDFVNDSKRIDLIKKFSTHASDVLIYPNSYILSPKKLNMKLSYSIISVGTLDAMYKAPDVVIEAIALLKRNALDVSLQWLGDGRYKNDMIDRARQAGVSDRINFIGQVSSANEVISYLDEADLFVLPSRQEGLPRAFVEAMARGLPCIGTKIGGIPELLDEQALVPVNNSRLLAAKIITFLTTPGLADAQAARNLKEAHKYEIESLESRRKEFYHFVRDVS
jgi:glycosyltransferase involved in cell wall biosynthesis